MSLFPITDKNPPERNNLVHTQIEEGIVSMFIREDGSPTRKGFGRIAVLEDGEPTGEEIFFEFHHSCYPDQSEDGVIFGSQRNHYGMQLATPQVDHRVVFARQAPEITGRDTASAWTYTALWEEQEIKYRVPTWEPAFAGL